MQIITVALIFYHAISRNEKVPASVKTLNGGNIYNNFDTDAALMYSYTPDATALVPSQVTGFYGAGRLNHGLCSLNLTMLSKIRILLLYQH